MNHHRLPRLRRWRSAYPSGAGEYADGRPDLRREHVPPLQEHEVDVSPLEAVGERKTGDAAARDDDAEVAGIGHIGPDTVSGTRTRISSRMSGYGLIRQH